MLISPAAIEPVVRTHCLVRTPPDVLLAQAALRHREQRCPAESTSVRAWSTRLRRSAVVWRSKVRGPWEVEWCLEAEPAATGTLAHLSAMAVSGSSQPRRMIASTVLFVWTRRELTALTRVSETLHGPYQRLSQHTDPAA